VLWCGAGSGFEKITSSGSSFISLPNTAYTVEGMTRGPDGNAWFTAESTARTLGQLALYGEIDETSGTVTTYAVPNPSSFASSEVSYQIGAITSGPSSLYFQTGVGAEAFVETGDTSGNVTQSVKLYYVNSAGLSLAYASDGNVWVVTGPSALPARLPARSPLSPRSRFRVVPRRTMRRRRAQRRDRIWFKAVTEISTYWPRTASAPSRPRESRPLRLFHRTCSYPSI